MRMNMGCIEDASRMKTGNCDDYGPPPPPLYSLYSLPHFIVEVFILYSSSIHPLFILYSSSIHPLFIF
jgi:hypothetical protein